MCNALVTINDTISPLAACLDTTIYINSAGVVNIDSSFVHDYSIVSCGTESIKLSKYSFFCSDLGQNTVQLVLTEDNGLKDTCYGIVTVLDSLLPVAICNNLSVYLDPSGVVSIDSSMVDNGSFDNCAIVRRYISKDNFDCSNIGINTIWFYVEDFYGNKDSCQSIVTVIDTNKPVALCKDTTIYINLGSVSITPAHINAGSYTACGPVSTNVSKINFSCADTGINIVQLYVVDTVGRIDSCSAIVTVIDTSISTFSCKDTMVYLNSNGIFALDSSFILDSISYASCNFMGFRLSKDTVNCADLGNSSIKLYVRNAVGRIDSCASTVTVLDTIKPTPICRDTSVYLDNTGFGIITNSFVDAGSFDNCSVDSIWLSKYIFDCNDFGIDTITMYVMDNSGNLDSCSSAIQIVDTINPNAICKDTIIYLNASGIAVIDSSYINNNPMYGCDIATITLSKDTFYCSEIGLNTIKMIVSDVNGNSDSCSAIVTVLDTLKPTAYCQNISVYLDATGNVVIDSSMIDNGSIDNCAISTMSLSQAIFNCTNLGLNTVSLIVSDISGNSDTCFSSVTVYDTVLPVAVCKDTTVYIDSSGVFTLNSSFINNGSYDNCGLDSIWINTTIYSCYDVGQDTVSLFVRDSSGNIDSCSSIITILDTINPVAYCKDTTIYLNTSGFIIVDSSLINNNPMFGCDVLTIKLSKDTFDCYNVGVNVVTMVVTDINGNIDSCSANVTVLDTLAPIVNCQNISVYLDASGNAVIDSSMIDNGSNDNCAISTMSLSQTLFNCTNLGLNTVTLTVTDVNGNSDTCNSIVTIIDSLAPTPVCRDTSIFLNASGTASITNSFIDNGSFDNCIIDSIWLSKYTFDCTDFGNDTIQLYAVDSSGNIDSCQAVIHVMDTTNPTAICKDTTIYLTTSGIVVIDSSYINNNPMYGCDIATIKLSKDTFDCSNIGANFVRMVITDINGNTDSCTAIVTVFDTLKPVVNCQNITVYLNATGNVVVDSSMIDNGSVDNCGISTMSLSQTSFNCLDTGINIVTLTVTDVNGNSDTCSSIITIIDSIPPTIICKDTTVYLNSFGKVGIDTSFVNNGVFDNCGVQSISISKDSFDCSNTGPNLVTLYSTDVNGNTNSCVAIVTVLDTNIPAAFAGNDTNICGYLTINLCSKPALPSQTGYWSTIISGVTPILVDSNNPKSQVTNLAKGSHYFVWSVSNGPGCKVVNDTVEVNILDTLFSIAGPDISLCDQSSTSLNANFLPNGTTGRWTYGLGTPTIPIISDTIISNPVVSNLVEGTYPFYWKVNNGLCKEEVDTVLVDVYDSTSSSVGADQNLCAQYSTTLLGNTPSGRATGKWSILSSTNSSSPTFLNDSNPSTTISGLAEGTYQIIWTVSNGNCPPAIDTLVVNVYDQPVAFAGNDTILCSLDSIQLFAANPSGSATGVWSLDPSLSMTPSPIIKSPTLHNSDLTNMTIGSNQQIIWTVSNGTCTQDSDTALIIVQSIPVVNAGRDSSYCATYTINLNALPLSQPAVGSWILDTTFAPNRPTIVSKNNPSTTVTGLIEGVYRFVWRGLSLPCYDISDTVEITISDQHTAFVGSDINLCDQISTTINGNVVTGTATSRWYVASSTPNIPVFNPAQASTTLGGLVTGGIYNLVWEITNGVCPASRDTLRVLNQFSPVASFIQDKTEICQNESVTFTSTSTMTLPETITTEVWKVNGNIVSGPSHTENFTTPGYYDLTLFVSASNGCIDTAEVKDAVFVHTNPIADFSISKNPTDDYKMKIYINDMAQFATNYTYRFGDANTSNLAEPYHLYKDSGSYGVWQIVSNDFGCLDSAFRTIYVQQAFAYVPSAFTPNNDGTNDIFLPIVSGNDNDKGTYKFQVFDRWGEEVFKTDDSNEGWDGSFKGLQSQVGTYSWKITYKEVETSESITKFGHVNLIR